MWAGCPTGVISADTAIAGARHYEGVPVRATTVLDNVAIDGVEEGPHHSHKCVLPLPRPALKAREVYNTTTPTCGQALKASDIYTPHVLLLLLLLSPPSPTLPTSSPRRLPTTTTLLLLLPLCRCLGLCRLGRRRACHRLAIARLHRLGGVGLGLGIVLTAQVCARRNGGGHPRCTGAPRDQR